MATPVIMPRQGQSVESCIIGKWHKKKGDPVSPGDLLFTYETDKSTFDEEAKVGGILLDIFFEEGDDVPCLTNVCVIGDAGESTDEFNPNKKEEEKTPETTQAKQAEGESPTAPVKEEQAAIISRKEGERIFISPRARHLAEKAGVDILSTPGTGPNGRIIERDVAGMIEKGKVATAAAFKDYQGKALDVTGSGIGGRITMSDLAAPGALESMASVATTKAAETGPDYEEVANPTIRKTIAKAMHASLSNMAQLTLNSSFDMTEINEFRAKIKASKETLDLPNITINDIILYAVSRTILDHPYCNAHYYDDKTLLFKNVHLGVAVDTPRGLMVPTLFNANRMSLSEISTTSKSLGEACRNGTILPDSLKGGTFTVTNLGTLGIESFTPVINPPQTCILGVNTIETKVKMAGSELKPYPAMTLSLTFDHRALDGAQAARFLKALVVNLENFSALLAR